MPKDYKRKTDRPYTNGKPQELPVKFKAGFLAALDGRTDLAKTLRSNYDRIVEELGGRAESGHVKSALIERFCWLEAILQGIESDMANGKVDRAESLGRWIQAVNSLSGLAKVLGVDRGASDRVFDQLYTQPAIQDAKGDGDDASS
jgi:hypothetical protein